MTFRKRIVALMLMLATLATSGIVFASEKGRTNTRNALGAATIIMAVKGNTTGMILGGAGTVIAQNNLNKSIRARHRRDAYRRAHRVSQISRARRARIARAQRRARINAASRRTRANRLQALRR